MKRKFITNLALLLFLNLLVKPFWVLGIDRSVQNLVGAEAYGFYFSLFSFSLLLNMILDLGIVNYNSRNIARNHHLVSSSLSNIVSFKFLLAIIYFVISMGIAIMIGYDWQQLKLLLVLVLNQFLASFILYFRSNLSGLHLFKTDSVLSVLDRLLMILICSLLIWGNITGEPFRIEWFVYAQTAAYFTTALISFLLVLSKAEFFRLNIQVSSFLAVLKKSYPFALLSLFMVFYYRVDSVMLERLLPDGKFQVGMYAQAYRLLDAAAMMGFLFGSLLLPIFSKMIKKGDKVESLTSIAFLLLFIPAAIITAGCLFYRSEIMDLLYKRHVIVSADILAVLMIGYLGISASYIFGTLLTANNNLKELNIMAAAGVVLNIGLNFILIPRYSALGSAVASMITQLLTATAQLILVYRIFNFSLNHLLIFRLVVYITLLILTGLLLDSSGISWYSGIIVLGLAGLFFSFILYLLRPKSLYQIVRSGEEMD